ncbi:PAP/OAS1 substrate-binding domain-containing protein [Martensiomyces pterosporus]|nr:PAP/OAS1 substrate-binding domain-containing protein [Martensiomyces pterosporus]
MAISKGEQAKLDAELVARLCDLEPSRENKQEVDHLVALICRLGRKANPKGKVYASLFGSRVYNMCTNSSDVDIMVTVRVPDKNPEVAYTRFFNRLAYAMRCHRKFELVVKVSHARVPIIKFTYRCHSGQVLDGDISLNGSMGAAKSKLIATYVDMDPRVRQVLLVLKLWGKARGITDHNTLNSYGLMMMGIAFLISRRVVPPLQLVNTAVINQAGWKRLARIQSNADEVHSLYGASIADATSERGSGSVIQCIQTRNPLPDWRVDGKRAYFLGGKFISEWKSPNKHSAPKLLYEFFRYYGCEFDPMRNVVSPRLGSAGIPRSWLYELQVPEPAMYLSLPTQWRSDLRLLAIEDPFELSVNCARNATPEWCEGLFWEMRRAAWALQPRPGGFGGIQRLLLEPSQDTFGDASVWATAYHRLLPLLQNLVEEQVFDAKKDVRPASIIDMGELENTELAKASDGQKEAAPDAE